MTATAGMCQEHYYASVNTQSKYKIWVRLCMSCGHLDSADLDAQIAAASEEAARVARIDELVTFNRHANERPSSDIPYWLVDYTRNRMGALHATPPTQPSE